MDKIIISLIVLVFLTVTVSAAMDPIPAYCEHQEYTFEYSQEESIEYCIFDENNKCDAREFYNGECGLEYKRDIPCRQEGEVLFSEFEECCEGFGPPTSLWNRRIGQPSCVEKVNFFQKIWRWIF